MNMAPNNTIQDNIVYLEPCRYEDIGSYTKVISKESIGHVIRLHLNSDQCRWCLYSMVDTGTDKPIHEGAIEQETITWLKIFSQELNLDPGQHIYKLTFIDHDKHTEVIQFISYIIQTSDVEKPYIYMERESK